MWPLSSFKISCTVPTHFHVMLWDDKIPIWWDEMRRVTWALSHCMRLLLTFWQCFRRRVICFQTVVDWRWLKLKINGGYCIWKASMAQLFHMTYWHSLVFQDFWSPRWACLQINSLRMQVFVLFSYMHVCVCVCKLI